MIGFPLKFVVNADAKAGISTKWVSQTDALPPITCSVPTEFSGPGGGYNPEELFGLAILNCMITVFKIACEKKQVTFEKLQGKAIITIDKETASNRIAVTELNIYIDITGASNKEKVKNILETVAQDCPVVYSVKSGKTFNLNVL